MHSFCPPHKGSIDLVWQESPKIDFVTLRNHLFYYYRRCRDKFHFQIIFAFFSYSTFGAYAHDVSNLALIFSCRAESTEHPFVNRTTVRQQQTRFSGHGRPDFCKHCVWPCFFYLTVPIPKDSSPLSIPLVFSVIRHVTQSLSPLCWQTQRCVPLLFRK